MAYDYPGIYQFAQVFSQQFIERANKSQIETNTLLIQSTRLIADLLNSLGFESIESEKQLFYLMTLLTELMANQLCASQGQKVQTYFADNTKCSIDRSDTLYSSLMRLKATILLDNECIKALVNLIVTRYGKNNPQLIIDLLENRQGNNNDARLFSISKPLCNHPVLGLYYFVDKPHFFVRGFVHFMVEINSANNAHSDFFSTSQEFNHFYDNLAKPFQNDPKLAESFDEVKNALNQLNDWFMGAFNRREVQDNKDNDTLEVSKQLHDSQSHHIMPPQPSKPLSTVTLEQATTFNPNAVSHSDDSNHKKNRFSHFFNKISFPARFQRS